MLTCAMIEVDHHVFVRSKESFHAHRDRQCHQRMGNDNRSVRHHMHKFYIRRSHGCLRQSFSIRTTRYEQFLRPMHPKIDGISFTRH